MTVQNPPPKPGKEGCRPVERAGKPGGKKATALVGLGEGVR